MHRARLVLPGGEEVYRALAVEAERSVPRTRVEVRRGREGIEVFVEAEDTTALRAALNSYLRWYDLAVRSVEVVKDGER